MRHAKKTFKLNRTGSHRKALMANMLKALITHGKISTTLAKAKHLRSYADNMVTLAKRNTLADRRRAIADLQVRFNPLTSKQAREAKNGSTKHFNDDRLVIKKLFEELGPRFKDRQGGYTHIIKSGERVGDNAQMCVIEYLPN